MKTFLVVYKGPETAPDASHEGWPQWFQRLGEHLVDRGAPLAHGCSLHHDGSTGNQATPLNGYSLIQAEEREEALRLLSDHPYLSLGQEYTVEMFDIG
jgi:hypothetical protein